MWLLLPLVAAFIGMSTCQNDQNDVIPTVQNDVIPTAPPIPVPPRVMSDNDQLLLVQAVWRHGDRAPVMTYPTDVHQEAAWPNGWGELTQLGMRQQYALGRLLRRRYINGTYNFLNPNYNAKEIYIRSTDVNRTLLSAYANLAGMFAGARAGIDYPSYERWPTGWTPIPVHTIDLDQDYVGNVFAPCERALELDTELRETEEYKKIVEENKEFLDFVSNKTGFPVELPILYLIHDVAHIENIYNMSQPAWMTKEVMDKMKNLTIIANEYTYGIAKPYVPEMIKLRGGSMLGALIEKTRHKVACFNDKNKECNWMGPLKYYAYSAHDTTVAALLTTFGDEMRVLRGGLPKYTASVVIELWNLEGEGPAVRILFHGAFHHNYHVITHLTKGCPQNKEFCPLKTFEKRSARFVPTNMQKECQSKNTKNRTNRKW